MRSDHDQAANFDKSALTLPILASILVHAVIIIAVAAPLITPPKSDTAIQTALVNQEAFNSAKTALMTHHANQNPKTANASSAITPGDKALMQAQTQRRYQPQVSTSASTVQAYHPLPESAPLESSRQSAQVQQASPKPTGQAEYSHNVSGSEQATGGEPAPSRAQINAAISSVKQRIEAIWQRYPKQPNQTITFQVNIDQQGNVTSIQFGGGHPDLRESVEAAVYAAAPFYELGGIRDSIRLQFTTEQLIMDHSQTPNEP